MPDNLLYLYSTAASISVVLMLTLVLEVRKDLDVWIAKTRPRWFDISQACYYAFVAAALTVSVVVSVICLVNDESTALTEFFASFGAIIGFGAIAVGVVLGALPFAFARRGPGAKGWATDRGPTS